MSTKPRIRLTDEEWDFLDELVRHDVEDTDLTPPEEEQATGIIQRLDNPPRDLRLQLGPGQALYLYDLLREDIEVTILTEEDLAVAKSIQNKIASKYPAVSPRRRAS